MLFSDGVTEAMDPEDQLYGVGRLRAAPLGKNELPLDEIQKTVLESVENFARSARQADDLTLLLVSYLASRFESVRERVTSTDNVIKT